MKQEDLYVDVLCGPAIMSRFREYASLADGSIGGMMHADALIFLG